MANEPETDHYKGESDPPNQGNFGFRVLVINISAIESCWALSSILKFQGVLLGMCCGLRAAEPQGINKLRRNLFGTDKGDI
jgi:hypothetical protein